MRRYLSLGFLFSFFAAPLIAQQPAPSFEVADRILVVVGDSVVLKSDIDLEFLQMREARIPIEDSVAVRKKVIERRIGELVLLQAALRDTSINITDEQVSQEVQRELDARRRQFGGEAQFLAALAQAGLTVDQLRLSIGQEIGGRLVLREYIQKMSRSRKAPPVTDAAIEKHFAENRATFGQRPATITFAQVVIAPKASDSARATARVKAEEALQRLRAGGDFETVAKQYSEDPSTRDRGGDLGWFRSGTMVREFDQVAFALRPGDVSGIVETSFGFHIIKLEKARGAERQARHILIIPTVTADDAERMRAFAGEITDKVRAGASIDSLIKAIGDPNEQARIGPYPKDRLPAPYNTVLATAQTGDVLGPLELAGAAGAAKFAVIRVIDTRPAGEYSLDDPLFRAELRETLQQNTLVDELISDLRKRTLVEYRSEQ